MSLTVEERRFLSCLTLEPKSRKELPLVVTREQDRARQSCRRRGLATFIPGNGWRLTTEGDHELRQSP